MGQVFLRRRFAQQNARPVYFLRVFVRRRGRVVEKQGRRRWREDECESRRRRKLERGESLRDRTRAAVEERHGLFVLERERELIRGRSNKKFIFGSFFPFLFFPFSFCDAKSSIIGFVHTKQSRTTSVRDHHKTRRTCVIRKCPRYSNPSRRSPYLRAARAATRGSRRRRRGRCRRRKERRSSPKRYVLVAPFCLLPLFFYKGGMCARIVTPVHPRAKARWTRRRRFFAEDDVLNSILDDARWFASTGGRFCPRAARKETKKNFILGRETSLLQVFKGPENPLFFVTPKRQNTKD